MEHLAALVLAVVGGIVVVELYAWLPSVTTWLTRRAARLVPRNDRERCLEEWQADLDTLPLSLAKVLRCCDLFRAAIVLRGTDVVATLRELRRLLVAKWIVAIVMTLVNWSLLCLPSARSARLWLIDIAKLQSPGRKMKFVERCKSQLFFLADRRQELEAFLGCERWLDELLSSGLGARFPTLRADLLATRTAIKEMNARLQASMAEWAQTIRDAANEIEFLIYEAQLKRIAVGGYRCLPRRRE